MADGSSIEWTEATWNPIRGCTRISEGCRNCYAERVAARYSGKGQAYEGLARFTSAGPRWTGRLRLIEEHLEDPIRWKRPRRIFVNSMSDVFHEQLLDQQIQRVFDVMLKAPQHTYQLLTKRSDRLLEWVTRRWGLIIGQQLQDPERFLVPPHIWGGVSVEDQRAAELRIPDLVAAPLSVRWLSIEPQIEGVKLRPEWLENLHWVVIGGESGPGARLFDIQWARDLVAQCRGAGVAVFVKQLGAKPHVWTNGVRGDVVQRLLPLPMESGKGGDPAEWPADLRVREYPMGAPG